MSSQQFNPNRRVAFQLAVILAGTLAATPVRAQQLESIWYSTPDDRSTASFLAHANQITIVSPQVFSLTAQGTIRGKIAYGRPDATDEQVLEAARATFVDRFVHSLPEGYDTVIDEEGSNLSAGERQLVTIARAFLTDPALLILDEATSSVDTRTELLLQHAMAALRTDRTSFVIAHRLSTIRDADLILVMEDGAIVEQGTHDDLLSRDGAYARLYNSQFQAAEVA